MFKRTKAINDAMFALSDVNRRRILKMLRDKPLTAGQISSRFPLLSRPSMSHHFSVLKEANLIDSEKVGQNVIYTINTTVFYDILSGLLRVYGEENETKS
ncbi:MAG: metalloregulator ArsR/SmtB family transcription factor [Patescibacteria group bacterium]|nr:metalloregulator ArsR/SmtB family transcription factor [Patescibacteria group bacterium]